MKLYFTLTFYFIEFVRSYAEHCLKDIIQLLFSRLVTLSKEQGSSSKVRNKFKTLLYLYCLNIYIYFIFAEIRLKHEKLW